MKKSTKTNATKTPRIHRLVSAADFANPEEAAEWLAELPTAPAILDRFSAEQQIQIRRLASDLKLEQGAFGSDDETIATLAGAALFVFGLDPIARGSYSSIASVVFGNPMIDDEIRSPIGDNEVRQAGNYWTGQHRDAERKMFKGRAA